MAISQKTYRYTAPVSKRTFVVEQRKSNEWEAWFDDNHAVTYVETTMKAVLAEILGDDIAK